MNRDSQVSSHFVLGKGGEITQLVPVERAAWTQGVVKNPTHPYVKAHSGVNPNQYCISIECEGVWSETKGALTDKQLAAAAELTRYIVAEVKRIYKVDIPIDREHMIGHCEINPVTRPHCPGEAFPYDALIAAARGEMEIPTSSQKLPYTVQCGAFADADNAAKLYAKLDDKGYFAFLQNEATIKVCVGKFASSEEAQRTCDDLKKKGFAGFVTTI